MVGRKPMRISQLDAYPTDEVIDAKIQQEVDAQAEEEAREAQADAARRAARLRPPPSPQGAHPATPTQDSLHCPVVPSSSDTARVPASAACL